MQQEREQLTSALMMKLPELIVKVGAVSYVKGGVSCS